MSVRAVPVSKKSSHRAGVFWRPLVEGDLVDIVAPGYRTKSEIIEAAELALQKWGLRARVSQPIFGRDLLSAHSDGVRFSHLKRALLSPESKAVWCLRGGYGSNRLLPELAKLKRPSGPAKLVLGLSDITSLHLFLKQNWNWSSLHGPLLDRLAESKLTKRDERELRQMIFGEVNEIIFTGLKPLNQACKKRSLIEASVTGGNLTVLQCSLATPFAWQTAGQILFFEDVGERGYRIDRMLVQMQQAGHFAKARAIIFGQFTGGLEADGRSLVWPVIRRFALEQKIPVLSGLPSGHDVRQRPLPLSTRARLDLHAGSLTCASGSKIMGSS